MPSKLNPYLSFNGTAREAMTFYKAALGGKLTLNTYKESNASAGPSEDNKIMHGMLEADNGITLMGSDAPKGAEHKPGTNVSISLSGDNEAELTGYYKKLSAGGTIREPLAKAPWGDTFGMFADRFGIEWMVNIAGKK